MAEKSSGLVGSDRGREALPGSEVRAERAARSRGFRGKLRAAGLICAALLPQPLKRLLYRWGFGYRIHPRAGMGIAYLDCESLILAEEARISHGVVFFECGQVQIGRRAIIGALNLFSGGKRIVLGDYSLVRRLNFINAIRDHNCTNNPDASFYLGYGAVVTAEHRIDFTDEVSIGRCSILGGRNSSIWTHNIRSGKPVKIGDYCYLGSEIRVAPGASVADCCIVGLGSVITGALPERHALHAGVPATRRRALADEDYDLIYGKTRPDLPDQEYPPRPGGQDCG